MARNRKTVEPKIVKATGIDPKRGVKTAPDGLYDPANPGHRWERPLQAPGRMQVDFEQGDRRMGARQADALVPAHRQRRAVRVGFRLGRAPPQTVCAVAADE